MAFGLDTVRARAFPTPEQKDPAMSVLGTSTQTSIYRVLNLGGAVGDHHTITFGFCHWNDDRPNLASRCYHCALIFL